MRDLGYFDIGLGRLGGVSVHDSLTGSYRSQLAYLISKKAEYEREKH